MAGIKTILVADKATRLKTTEAELIARFDWEPGDGGPKYQLAVTRNFVEKFRRVTEIATGASICTVRESAPREAARFARQELAKVVARMGGPTSTRERMNRAIADLLSVQRKARGAEAIAERL